MGSTLLRIISLVASLLIATSFLLFVIQQTKGGEQTADREIQGISAPAATPPKPEQQPRRFIDHAAHRLTTPFNGIPASDSSKWVKHTVPTVLGLLLYGVGLGFLARYAAGKA